MRKLCVIPEMSMFSSREEDVHVHPPPPPSPVPPFMDEVLSEETELIKWVGIFKVRIFWVGIFRGKIF